MNVKEYYFGKCTLFNHQHLIYFLYPVSSIPYSETNEQSSHDDRPPTPTENDKFPDEAPPPYQTDSDLPPYPPDYQEQLQASLEEKLIRVGLLNVS